MHLNYKKCQSVTCKPDTEAESQDHNHGEGNKGPRDPGIGLEVKRLHFSLSGLFPTDTGQLRPEP